MATGNGVGARGHPGLLFRQAVREYDRTSHLSNASLGQFGGGSQAIDAAAKSLYNKFSSDFDWFIERVRRVLNYSGMDQYYLTTMMQEKYPDKLRWEAAIEVLTEQLYFKAKDKALLLIVYEKSELKHHEHPPNAVNQHVAAQTSGLLDNARLPDEPLLDNQRVVLNFVEALLKKETAQSQINCCDENGQCPLHHAAKRGFKDVVSKLLEHNADPVQKDFSGKMPLPLALERKDDESAAVIVKHMANNDILKLFLADKIKKDSKAQCSFQDIVNNNMTNTALAILNCMVAIDEDNQKVTLNYSPLEADAEGRTWKHPMFEKGSLTAFQLIAKTRNKDVACHFVIKQLIKHKWITFARRRFILKFLVFLMSIFFMTFAAVSGVMSSDPTHYDLPIDKARAVCEVGALMMVFFKVCPEIYQMGRRKLEYWKEIYNYIDLVSLCCIIAVVPLRWCHATQQWQVFGVGYLLWTFRFFKYAVVTRRTGAYCQILWQMISRDFPQFTIVFLVILLAFSGSFLLTLKGENSLDVHGETSNFWEILFTGVRILIEGQPVVDYTGSDGYKVLSTILMVVFLFVSIVMLLNILIAQLSTTYEKVQQDADREFIVNRMWIIGRMEGSSMFNYCRNRDNQVELTQTLEVSDWIRITITENGLEDTQLDIRSLESKLNNLDSTLRHIQTLLKEQSIALNQIQSSALIHRQSPSSALLPRSGLLQSQRYSWRDLPTTQ